MPLAERLDTSPGCITRCVAVIMLNHRLENQADLLVIDFWPTTCYTSTILSRFKKLLIRVIFGVRIDLTQVFHNGTWSVCTCVDVRFFFE